MKKPMRILLVDDDADLRQILIELIQKLKPDVEVVQATNGSRAIELLHSERFNALITDIRMPG